MMAAGALCVRTGTVGEDERRCGQGCGKPSRSIHLKICFSIPNATAERRQSSTFQMFQCVSCSEPESWILLALGGEFGVISAARLSRCVLASIVKHSSDPLNLPSEPFPSRRREVCELGWLRVRCPCTLSNHEKWALSAPRAL